MVRLLMQANAPPLGDFYCCALKQFYRLEHRLSSDSPLRDKYIAFMKEYIELGHMEALGTYNDSNHVYYIPHHAVLDKFRVVFNASAPTSNGVSLNDIQHEGPTIQNSLNDILFRFRRYAIALTADVEKMFRQVLVAPEDPDLQRSLWRESPNENVKIYQLMTVPYGMACSPYNAVRALQQCAVDNYGVVGDLHQAESARSEILSSFYVDDFLTSCTIVEDTVTLAKNVSLILSNGCFRLRKWNSNRAAVLAKIGESFSLHECNIHLPIATVLGLRWDPVSDELLFMVSLKQYNEMPTKRRVLSDVAQLYDPTGFLVPAIISDKVFIQTLWSTGISWDTPLPKDLCHIWSKFRDDLSILDKVRVPRWLSMDATNRTSLFDFCDASQKAYAAVVYARTIDNDDKAKISLLTARTKVAPLKGATIPRLELCGAPLLAKTICNVRKALSLEDTDGFQYCLELVTQTASDVKAIYCQQDSANTTIHVIRFAALCTFSAESSGLRQPWCDSIRIAESPFMVVEPRLVTSENNPLWPGTEVTS
ncbi:uncharacterized protein LOC126765841 [Bactrocera neohumeralis]|uniref:uncharacterized protein LOC126765841 n=1 Tax=Bactrocera neohumeralis TaxID=98809 RepID=UPI002165EB23|nr:uncharacterized protein LOC126765841 [Bactrocera neohumeralis]